MSFIIAGIVSVLLLAADQFTKYLISTGMTLGESKPFINGLIDFTYIHNEGGAWGMLSGYTWVLLAMTSIIVIIFIAMLVRNKLQDKLMFWSVCLILSGGIGNMIDRVFRDGKVVDFIHLHFMPDFPVFNLADCAVVIGAGLLIVYFAAGMIKDSRESKKAKSEEACEKPAQNAGSSQDNS